MAFHPHICMNFNWAGSNCWETLMNIRLHVYIRQLFDFFLFFQLWFGKGVIFSLSFWVRFFPKNPKVFFHNIPSAFSTALSRLIGMISCEGVQDTNNIHVSLVLFYLYSYFTPGQYRVALPCELYLSVHWCSVCPLKPSALSHFSHCLGSFLTPPEC